MIMLTNFYRYNFFLVFLATTKILRNPIIATIIHEEEVDTYPNLRYIVEILYFENIVTKDSFFKFMNKNIRLYLKIEVFYILIKY